MQKIKEHNHRSTISTQRYAPIVCLFVLGVAVSVGLFLLLQSRVQAHQRNEFESRAYAYANAVEVALNDYAGALLFLGDFFNNSMPVTRQRFTSFVQSVVARYPGVQAFGWDPLVKDDERSRYESAARNAGFDDFEFRERSEANQLVRAARREEYVVVYYLYPMEGNRPAFGFDIASNKTRLKAITKGFDTGKLSATNRITLVQETGNQFGILLLLPIYHQGAFLDDPAERRNSRKGFVVEVLRIGQAVDTALSGFSDEGIGLTLYDMSAVEGDRLLYHRPSVRSKSMDHQLPAQEIQKGLFWRKTFNFADRQWQIVLSPSALFYEPRRMRQPWIVLAGSLVLTALLALYMLRRLFFTAEIEQRIEKQDQTNQRLENEVKERTAAEAQRDKTILNLKQALDEVQSLRGILPLCSFCKKVRDDQGYWEQVDVYIHKNSQADISHSICPDCAKEHYPELSGGLYPEKE